MNAFDHRGHVNALLAGFGQVVGDPGLALDEDNSCTIVPREDVSLELVFAAAQGQASVVLASVVGALDEGDRVPFLTEMLRANLYWRGTEGATLSLGPEDHVLLHREIPVEESLTLPDLRQSLDSLIDVTRVWRVYLTDHQPALPDME